MDIRYISEYIRESVSTIEAAEAMGIRVDRGHRCPCPIHGGQDNNMRLYEGSRGYYCFVCHAYGSVIDLVRAVQGCTFMEAVRWLNATFRLGLDVEEKAWGNRLRRATRTAGRGRERNETKHRGQNSPGNQRERQRTTAETV